tara:strand:+ start:3319 stop:3597 length:279 start_codon:yes stop_codon:yes gene_type:complete
MNQFITKLVRQALKESVSIKVESVIASSVDGHGIVEIPNNFAEKFAELIVRECMKLCEHESNDDEYDQYDMGMSVKAEDIKASIMKEFGVEE